LKKIFKNFLKKIELKLRASFLSFVQLKDKSPRKISKPSEIFDKNKEWKILILRQDRIGDLLISVPLLKTLKQSLKHSTIDIILSEKNQVAKSCIAQYTDSQCVLPKNLSIISFLYKLRKKRYDICIDLFDNSSATSSFLLKFIMAKNTIGLEKSNASIYDFIIPLKDKNKHHIIDRIADLLFPFNIDPKELNFELEYKLPGSALDFAKEYFSQFRAKDKRKIILAINIAGSSESKFWGQSNNIAFIKEINKFFPDIAVLLFGTKSYLETLKEIQKEAKCFIAALTKDFNQYAALLSFCNFLLTPDTSAVHLAAAFKIPCICLYNISDGKFGLPWTPYKSPYEMLSAKNESLSNIPVSSVFEAFKEIYLKEDR
jgi:ADP-heptose:LPS heptosyltransferase